MHNHGGGISAMELVSVALLAAIAVYLIGALRPGDRPAWPRHRIALWIAGCLVTSGVMRRNAKARLLRDNVVVADNLTISSLKREKDDVTEVRDGYECGINLGSYNDLQLEDLITTYEMQEKPRI